MKYLIPTIMTAFIVAMLAGCTSKPVKPGAATKKVADQLLAAYTPLRRLTYRDACGSEGPITVCIDRITIYDTATLVETRIRNSSQESHSPGYASRASALLINDAGETSRLASGDKPGAGEMKIHFSMDGHFTGEPAALTVNNIGRSAAGKEYSVVVRLGR